MIECGPFGFLRSTNLESGKVTFNLRYWAKIKLLNEPVNDPCDEAREREILPISKGIEKLEWGVMGKMQVNLAEKAMKLNG